MTVDWAVLSFHLREQSRPIGILLADPSDALHLRIRTDWPNIVPQEYVDICTGLAEELEQQARDLGAASVLDWLADCGSNVFRIGSRQTAEIGALDQTLHHLFHSHVDTSDNCSCGECNARPEPYGACIAAARAFILVAPRTPVDPPTPVSFVEMPPDKIENLLRHEIALNESLDALMDRIFKGDGSEEALESCKLLANTSAEPNPESAAAREYSRLMSNTLSEQDLRSFQVSSRPATKQIRRERFCIYRRLKHLFDIQIALSRKQKRRCMAIEGDWSGLGPYLSDSLTIVRYRLVLLVAGLLFWAGVPGSRDLCDTATAGIIRAAYF